MRRTLKAIKLPITAHDERIKPGVVYVGKVYDQWGAGTFHKQWYGWNWDAIFGAGTQYNSDFKELYELRPNDTDQPVILDILQEAYADLDNE
jgi:hypothetical protein